MIDYVELRAYHGRTNNFTILPSYKSLVCDEKNLATDVGVLSFVYPQPDTYSDRFYEALSLREGSILGVAPNGNEIGRYIIEDSSIDRTDEDNNVRSFNGRSAIAQFEDEIVFPEAWPVPLPAGHSFSEATPGFILRTLVARAKERGGLSWLAEPTFTGDLTSDGEPWDRVQTITYPTGNTLLQVLQDLQQKGLCDVRLVGDQLRVYNENALVSHFEPVGATFRIGQNATDQSESRDAKELATDIFIEGEEGNAIVYSNPYISPIGRRRTKYVQQGGITDTPTLYIIGQALQSQIKDVTVQQSIGTLNTDDSPEPWADYKVKDWLWLDNATDQGLQELQVQQISLQVAEDGQITTGLTLGTFIDDYNLRTQRRLDAITGANGTVYGSLPNTTPANITAPNPPTAISHQSASYIFGDGVAHAQVSLNWSAPSLNSDGSPQTESLSYLVEYKLNQDTGWRRLAPTPNIYAYLSDLPERAEMTVRIYAIDSANNYSLPSQEYTLTTAVDQIPPPQPSPPNVTAGVGAISVTWNGASNGGSSMGNDFSRIEIHASTTNGFQPGNGTYMDTLYAAGTTTIPLTGGQTYYILFVAYDKSGNYSLSDQRSSSPLLLGGAYLGLNGSWTLPGGSWARLVASKSPEGSVHVTGRSLYTGGNVTITPGNTALVATLPVDFRPPADIVSPSTASVTQASSGMMTSVLINSAGEVYVLNTTPGNMTFTNGSWVAIQATFPTIAI